MHNSFKKSLLKRSPCYKAWAFPISQLLSHERLRRGYRILKHHLPQFASSRIQFSSFEMLSWQLLCHLDLLSGESVLLEPFIIGNSLIRFSP